MAERSNALMGKLTRKELSIAGAILYSCEGTRLRKNKRHKDNTYYWVIEFTNSNPALIKLFVAFLRKIIKIEESRLKGQLFIYSDLDKSKLEKFWLRVSGIARVNLNKTIILKSKNTKYKPNPNGTFKTRYHSKEAFQRLDTLIDSVLK